MKHVACAIVVGALVAGVPTGAAASGWHRGHHHGRGGFVFHHHRYRPPSVFFGFGYYPYVIPYYYPYPYVIYPPPPLPDDTWSTPSPPSEERSDEPSDEEQASYGLVQLHGVPDGAEVDLDGRFWLRARDLDRRWVALPEGAHTLVVRVQGAPPVERRIDVAAGRMQVVRFDAREKRRT